MHMSKELNIGIIAEGVTDFKLLNELVCTLLDKNNECHLLQPTQHYYEDGWYGVIRFCKEEIAKVGFFSFLEQVVSNPFHALIIALDGDQYCEKTLYCAAEQEVPCGKFRSTHDCYSFRTIADEYARCPFPISNIAAAYPINERASRMEKLILQWCQLQEKPSPLIIVIPCEMIETWIVSALDGPLIDGKPVEEYPHIYDNYICRDTIYHNWPTNYGKESFFDKFNPITIERWVDVCNFCSQAQKFDSELKKLKEQYILFE